MDDERASPSETVAWALALFLSLLVIVRLLSLALTQESAGW